MGQAELYIITISGLHNYRRAPWTKSILSIAYSNIAGDTGIEASG